MEQVGFNKPYLTGNELAYIQDAVNTRKLSGNGKYTQLCQNFFERRYSFKKCLLTSSCTDALEMAAILCDIQPGDEIIMPSYTFVSTANAFVLRGARIVFVDSRLDHPGLDENLIEPLINSKTKAIVPVHYAGVACDMEKIMNLANCYGLFVIEDAAQAIDSYYKNKPLGGIGHIAAFSFHETKNVISGEGGMLVINDDRFLKRAEVIWEKGTNRSAFWRGEVDKYGWVDVGSSFLPSEITAAFLYAQLESLEIIQNRRLEIWNYYLNGLKSLSDSIRIKIPHLPEYSSNNAHLFYVTVDNIEIRDQLIKHLKNNGINAVFHYLSLHRSTYYVTKHDGRILPNSDHFSDCLLRLPFFFELKTAQHDLIIESLHSFFS